MWSRHLPRRAPPSVPRRHSQTAAANLPIKDEPTSDTSTLKIGDLHHGFRVQDVRDIPIFSLRAIRLHHDLTHAQYLHLSRNDPNNVFSINFRTTPMDSSGVPHILEHLVLCGSRAYPVRDPFFKMLNRSLATFMNAMTGADYTIYPFSTQNYADYGNLQKIYLDAVFRPNLNRLDFLQEGWRLEHSQDSELIVKGVVYNEMKGAFSENESVLAQKVQNLLLPDHTYGWVSGGDPPAIPTLTWERLKEFHKTHYHPANARFYSYGNFPLLPTLRYLDSEYLSQGVAGRGAVEDTEVPPQPRWTQPRRARVLARFDGMGEPFDKQHTLSVSLAMSDITEVYETFVLQFVSELLLKGPNAPLYRALVEPNISGGFVAATGLDAQTRDSVFTVGLRGLAAAQLESTEGILDRAIAGVVAEGFDAQHVEAVLHGYEIAVRHESDNFGLGLLFGLTPLLNHDGDVMEALRVDELIGKLRGNLERDPKYLQRVVQRYFKDNPHRLTLVMAPDKEYESRTKGEERRMVSEKARALSEADRKRIRSESAALAEEQGKSQDGHLLPTLGMGDICGESPNAGGRERSKVGPVPTQINAANTNGLAYFKGVLNACELTVEQQMLVPLLCAVVAKMGTADLDHRELDGLVSRRTAGLHVGCHVADSLFQLHSYEPGACVASHCLEGDAEAMWDIWRRVFEGPRLTNAGRFRTLVQLYMAELTRGVADAGHVYAMRAAGGLVSGAAYQRELMGGMQHISYMKRLVKTTSYDELLAEIGNIARILFDKNKLRCALNISPNAKPRIVRSFTSFVNSLPGNTFGKPNENAYTTTKVWTPSDAVNCQHHVLNVPVHYCSKSVLTVPYAHPDHARLRVLAKLLTSKYLHPELRERQGAYGGGARLGLDGVLAFYSYRDPHGLRTLDVFDGCRKWAREELGRATPQDVLEAKLGVFQAVDAPVPPCERGGDEFRLGLTPEILQRHRAELMAVDAEGLRSVSERYLDGSPSGKVILGPKCADESARKRAGELWTVLDCE